MPIVEVNMLAGRTKEQKKALIKAITEAVITSLDAKPETVRVILREMAPEDYGIAGVPKG
jgi:4-oxalocrotonate tautomerase